MRILCVTILLIVVSLVGGLSLAAGEGSARPNIVIIMTDDMG